MTLQFVLNQAMALHQKGQLGEAERLYRQVLDGEPANGLAWYLFAMLRLQQGRAAEALDAVEQALKRDPNMVQALHLRGVLFQGLGRRPEALASFDGVVAKKPDHAEAWYNRGVVLNELGRAADALASFDKTVALRPDNAEAWNNRGAALKALGQSEAALESYAKAIKLKPGFADAWYNRGIVLQETGRFDEAVAAFDKAVAVRPDHAQAWNNRGAALHALERYEEALISYDFALKAQPAYAEAWNNRGITLRELDRDTDALASYDRALALWPDYANAHYHRGVTLRDMDRSAEAMSSYDRALALGGETSQLLNSRGIALSAMEQLDPALASFDRALALDPGHADAWNNRGAILNRLGRYNEALTCCNKALALKPDDAETLRNRGQLLWDTFGRHDDAVRDLEYALALDPGRDYLRGDLLHLRMLGADWRNYERETAALTDGVRSARKMARPFMFQAISQSPADLAACSALYAADLYPFKPTFSPGPWRGHDRIRLGYVSGEFRTQPTTFLTAGLYEAHDKSRFELIAFDNDRGDSSLYRGRLETAFDRFVDISGMSHTEAAQAVRDQEIDILISLNGYFGNLRMELFAQRPAPVQVNYLGFPATLGADYIDYILADRFVIPQDEKRHYAEQVVWLPESYQVNDSKRRIASERPGRAQCGLPENAFVFCNFNQAYKLTPPMFAVWMRILKAVDGSVLWMLQDPKIPALEFNLKREAERHGVAGHRLIFAPYIGIEQHLARLSLGDLFLDCVPYNAHTTASDALWAGLPLLTVRGHAFAGRVAASLLNALDMPELVTESLADFEALAVTLARAPARLAALRQKLADNRLVKPLFDTARFTRHIEAAYARMWEISQRGEKPQGFSVPPID